MRERNYSLCYKVDSEETTAGEVAKPEDSPKRACGKLASNGLDQLKLFLFVDRCRLLQFSLQL